MATEYFFNSFTTYNYKFSINSLSTTKCLIFWRTMQAPESIIYSNSSLLHER
jgi:hypothetical protein